MILSITADRLRTALSRSGMAAALALVSPGALAQTSASNEAAADALYEEGRALLKAGDRAAGCAKFEASQALSPAASTMLNIARCHEQEGKIATAWADYTRALRLNSDTAGVERRKQLAALAREGLRALEPRVPRLRVVLTNPPPGLRAACDGKALPAAALGEALPLDPGPHELRVSAPGYRMETRSVRLEEGKTAVVKIDLRRAADEEPSRGWSRPAGIALSVAGAAGLGLGAVTGLASLDRIGVIKSSCPGYPHCPSDDQANRDRLSTARTLGSVSTAGFIAGGALAAAGITLLVLQPGDKRSPAAGGAPPSSLARSVRVILGPGRLGLHGDF